VRPDELRDWLEWAGGRLLSLGGRKPGPAEPRIAWPDFPQETATAYGYGKPTLRLTRPAKDEIPVMDEILAFPNLVSNVTQRRIVQCRSLVLPINGRYLYSWRRIARLLSINHQTAISWHGKGLEEIARKAEPSKICLIREFLSDNQLPS